MAWCGNLQRLRLRWVLHLRVPRPRSWWFRGQFLLLEPCALFSLYRCECDKSVVRLEPHLLKFTNALVNVKSIQKILSLGDSSLKHGPATRRATRPKLLPRSISAE